MLLLCPHLSCSCCHLSLGAFLHNIYHMQQWFMCCVQWHGPDPFAGCVIGCSCSKFTARIVLWRCCLLLVARLRRRIFFTYYLSYYPTCWCRWASSASKFAVWGCWKVKSSSSILTAVGSVVSRCSKVLSDWERGTIVGSDCWYICTSDGWQIWGYSCRAITTGYYCCVGAGRASTLGDESISVSLTGSAAVRAAICLVNTICSSRKHVW